MTSQPKPNTPASPGLSLFRGEEEGESLPTPSVEASPVELSQLLAAWESATSRLELTHAQLCEEVSRLTRELEAKNQELARKNRLADLGEMASLVAHEVRNSLTPITLYLSLVRRSLGDDPTGLDALTKAEAGFRSLETTVNDLLAFSASRQPQSTTFLVDELLQDVLASLAPQLEAQAVEVERDVTPGATVDADREMLRRAVLNLVLNALDVMPGGGELIITACDVPGGLELEIADSGPGLADDQAARVFEPFYTTKESGTGLGLSVVAHVAEAHGGDVIAENCPQGGAAFTLRLPQSGSSMEAAA